MTSQKLPRARKSIAHLPSPDITNEVQDKENATTDLSGAHQLGSVIVKALAVNKKLRSKSMGPGGLEALKEDTGNKKKTVGPPPKSILKPTIPLSPLKPIPTRKNVNGGKQTGSPTRSKSLSLASQQLIHESVNVLALSAGPSTNEGKSATVSPETTQLAPNKGQARQSPSSDESAVRDVLDEVGERRRKEKEDIIKQRDIRRKSLASRRVSFALEATLHTWNVLENQDATTSSASNDSTRRASTISRASALTSPNCTPGEEPPSTPPEQSEDETVKESPPRQRAVHQTKRRRSSGIPPMNFNNPDNSMSSSPSIGSATADEDATMVASQKFHGPGLGSDFEDDEDGPNHSVIQNAGNHVTASQFSDDSHTGESAQLQLALQNAANQAVTQGIDFDENGDLSMAIADDDITAAFQPWALRGLNGPKELSAILDQENVNPFSPAFRSAALAPNPESPVRSPVDNGDMSMEMTRAVGGIFRSAAKNGPVVQPKLGSPSRRQSVRVRRRSSGGNSSVSDGTMEFTTAIGGIQPRYQHSHDEPLDENEELSMEFTSVVGGINIEKSIKASVLSSGVNLAKTEDVFGEHEAGSNLVDDDCDMEMTTAVGGIMQIVDYTQFDKQDGAAEMDMTTAVGGILAPAQHQSDGIFEDDGIISARSLLRSATCKKSRTSVSASACGSPNVGLARPKGRPRKSNVDQAESTPTRIPCTPPKQITPQPLRPTTPAKTPPQQNVTMRTASPKKLFQTESHQANTGMKGTTPNLFKRSAKTGREVPSVVLAPKARTNRRFSGLGIDKEGLGSPRVAALLDRRTSIADRANTFSPQILAARGVRFDDPRALNVEITKQRDYEERRESGQFIMENEVDAGSVEKDVTVNLKEMIESMTPKKNKWKGRKSLAVGSAAGLLGKRPLELDEDEDEDVTPDRIKGREGSPVKKVKLQGPPSKFHTTGRSITGARRSLHEITANDRPFTPTTSSSLKGHTASTPKRQGMFKDTGTFLSAQKPLPTLGQVAKADAENVETEDADEKVRLQDFLNMTSIRFMELNTTKRRHTMARIPERDHAPGDENYIDEDDAGKQFEDSVVTGACTVPMLELYQHSCRELKKYISEGRDIVREIEAETFEENPPLFREYMSASPEDRVVMDSQFKNMKTHARLLSKGMWYEWRMKLLDGLMEGLVSVAEEMSQDDGVLADHERAIQQVLPLLLQEHTQIQQECAELEERAAELADCDQEELNQVRQQLMSVEEATEQKRQLIKQRQQSLHETDGAIKDVQEAKIECLDAIKEAQRLREECRGWSSAEVRKLKANVDALETKYGWAITSASSTALTMVYRHEIQLFFDVASFFPATSSQSAETSNSTISLTYIADTDEYRPRPLTTEKSFFLQIMRAHLQSLVQHQTHVKDLLLFVSAGWSKALAVSEDIRRLNMEHITDTSIVSDERLAVNAMVLLKDAKTKINVIFEVVAAAAEGDVVIWTTPGARTVYGEEFREDKMKEFFVGKIDDGKIGSGRWADAVRELERKLVAKAKRP